MKYVELETARNLMKLGYDGESLKTIKVTYNIGYGEETAVEEEVKVPRFDDVAYWLRDKYGVVITVIPCIFNGSVDYSARIESVTGEYHIEAYQSQLFSYFSYEDALEEAVLIAIGIVQDHSPFITWENRNYKVRNQKIKYSKNKKNDKEGN